MKTHLTILLLTTSVVLTACASAPVPKAQQTEAQSAIAEAKEAGAAEHSQYELTIAEDKIAKAEQEINAGNIDNARRLLTEATTDAKLAEAKALNTQAQANMREVRESINALKRETSRNQAQ